MAHDSYLAQPLISVVVAVYNGRTTVENCINSITRQNYPNKELIIIDGGSLDGTLDLLKANQEKISYWLSEQDNGIYDAWNKGVAKANGEWICFLGADDWFANDQVLEQVANSLSHLPDACELVYGQVVMVNKFGEEIYEIGDSWQRIQRHFFNGTNCLPTPGVFHHRNLFLKYGNFDDTYKIAGDYEFQMRIVGNTEVKYLPHILVTFMQQGGVSSNPLNALVAIKEIRKALNTHNLPSCNLSMNLLVFKVYIRHIFWFLLGEKSANYIFDLWRLLLGKKRYWSKIQGKV